MDRSESLSLFAWDAESLMVYLNSGQRIRYSASGASSSPSSSSDYVEIIPVTQSSSGGDILISTTTAPTAAAAASLSVPPAVASTSSAPQHEHFEILLDDDGNEVQNLYQNMGVYVIEESETDDSDIEVEIEVLDSDSDTISESSAEETDNEEDDVNFVIPKFDCAICLRMYIQHKPTQLHCGHSFCRSCIVEWAKKRVRCPVCRKYTVNKEFFIRSIY